jgi:hypothetical protein
MATLEQLAEAVLANEPLMARALAQELCRASISAMSRPASSADERVQIMAAALAELLAGYQGTQPPSWVSDYGALSEPLDLLPARTERLRALLAASAPEPLRRRNILAPEGFLRAV